MLKLIDKELKDKDIIKDNLTKDKVISGYIPLSK